jgi:uncharacterized protein YcbX
MSTTGQDVGTVRSIHRYPVKSMGGETLFEGHLGPGGLPGDRCWALRDEKAGEIRGAKKFPQLMRCAARCLEEPTPGSSVPAEIVLSDGRRLRTDDEGVSRALSDLLGREVTLWPLRPADDDAHYRRGAPDDPDFEKELRQVFGRLPDEPLPDLGQFDAEILEFTSPRGTYFDVFPVHLLTSSTLAAFEELNPGSVFGVERFRPNFVLDCPGAEGFVEADWAGRELVLGTARLEIVMPTVRCSMTTQATTNLPKDPKVLRSIVADGGQNLGVYAQVRAAGLVRTGDRAILL